MPTLEFLDYKIPYTKVVSTNDGSIGISWTHEQFKTVTSYTIRDDWDSVWQEYSEKGQIRFDNLDYNSALNIGADRYLFFSHLSYYIRGWWPTPNTYIYLVYCPVTNNYKIGRSKNPQARCRQLNTPVDRKELLWYGVGFPRDEHTIHNILRHTGDYIGREWYPASRIHHIKEVLSVVMLQYDPWGIVVKPEYQVRSAPSLDYFNPLFDTSVGWLHYTDLPYNLFELKQVSRHSIYHESNVYPDEFFLYDEGMVYVTKEDFFKKTVHWTTLDKLPRYIANELRKTQFSRNISRGITMQPL